MTSYDLVSLQHTHQALRQPILYVFYTASVTGSVVVASSTIVSSMPFCTACTYLLPLCIVHPHSVQYSLVCVGWACQHMQTASLLSQMSIDQQGGKGGGKAVRLFVGQKSICAFDFDIHTVYILLHEYAMSNRHCLSQNYSAEAQAWFSSLPSFARMKYTAPCVYETYWLFVLCLPKLKHTAMCI